VSAIYPLALFFVTGLVWFLTAWQNSRLLCAFRERYPQIAQREIPYVFDRWRHPEKAIFFFRRRAVELLREDAGLWRERQRFMTLSALSVLVPLLGFLPLFIYAVIMSQR
jgi:hypothetical protein